MDLVLMLAEAHEIADRFRLRLYGHHFLKAKAVGLIRLDRDRGHSIWANG